jgi:hypothetical protein
MPKISKIIFLGVLFFAFPIFVNAQQATAGINFFIDPSYDLTGRSEIIATLFRTTPNAYFYLDLDWWQNLDEDVRSKLDDYLSSLEEEFQNKIYPILTSTFGSEWKPGIDGDERITILIHPMKKEAGGYFNNGDEYPRLQNPRSNEREMVYLNTDYITSPLAKSFLAHEFTHLIIFNQKEKIRGVTEEIWLNEGRAEAAITLLGYDDFYQGSNLQRRVQTFLNNPSDSLTEWLDKEADYGVLNLFIQYLVDHYGIKILVDSLHSKKIGIPSINEALIKNGFKEDFSQIFTNWTIAVLVHNCQISEKYCYKNENLKTFYITPSINFLPLIGESTLTTTNYIKNWSAIWYRFTGGTGTIRIEFIGNPENKFLVPYAIQDLRGNWQEVSFFQLNEFQRGEILIPGFRTKIASVTIIPSIQSKIVGFDGSESSFPFSWTATTIEKTPEKEEAELIQKLLAQIEELKKQIAEVQAKINAILASRGQKITCSRFEKDLYFGIMNSAEVRCLQEFLKSQGLEIYPEGLVTGNFLFLTQQAVIRFQEKYASEILAPWGLTKGTGVVGSTTRAKINQLLGR